MKGRSVTYSDAIEQVMLTNGYYASLQLIYREFEKFRPFTGKTPLATIQERVQRDSRFTRIGLGVYALTEYLHKLPSTPKPKTATEKGEQIHSKMQGMLIELGNWEGFKTFTPDKGRVFDNKQLGSLVTLGELPAFTYSEIVQSTRYIDVLWFNEAGFPEKAFEVENSTDFRSSLVKFSDLRFFNMTFHLIAAAERRTKFEREVNRSVFASIRTRCHFRTYDELSLLYDARLNYQFVKETLAF